MARNFGIDQRRRDLIKVMAGGLLVGAPTALAFEPSLANGHSSDTTSPGTPESIGRSVDVAVIGAGPFGAAAAMHLAHRGVGSVALIGPSEGSTATTPAQLLASHYDESRNATAMDSDFEWAALAQRSIGSIRELEKRTGLEIFKEVGSLRVTQPPLDTGYFDLAGIRVNAIRLEVPLIELQTPDLNERFSGALFDAGSIGLLQQAGAGLINPRKLVEALRRDAMERGAIWLDDEVAELEPGPGAVEIVTGSGQSLWAARVLVATGAGPLGTSLLADRTRVTRAGHLPTHIPVPDDFETDLPPVMLTTSADGEFFGGFIAPPLTYPDGRRYLKAVGQAVSTKDQRLVEDQKAGAIRAVRRIFPQLMTGLSDVDLDVNADGDAVRTRLCTTLDSRSGHPVIEWVSDRVAVAIAGNGKGVKAAPEIGLRAAQLMMSPSRAIRGRAEAAGWAHGSKPPEGSTRTVG